MAKSKNKRSVHIEPTDDPNVEVQVEEYEGTAVLLLVIDTDGTPHLTTTLRAEAAARLLREQAERLFREGIPT